MGKNKYYNGKNAVITGAASGIGRAFAIALAKLGTNLIISDINTERLNQVKKEIKKIGVKVIAIKCDVTKQDDAYNLRDVSIKEMNQIDFLFSNAGIFMGGPFEYFSINQWGKIIDVNIWGTIHVIKAFIPKMLEQEFGHVIITSSIAGSMGSGAVLAYSTTKFANSGFGEALYGEFKGRGIDVSIVCPFPIKTNLIDNFEFAFPPGLLESSDSEALERGIKAGKAHYWNEFTKKKGMISGFCGGFEVDRAIKRIMKKISKKKLYVSERRYLRFFQFIRGAWPGLYKVFLRLSGNRQNKLIKQTCEKIFNLL